ncbi:MAG: hypothetical protein GQ572_00840 [Gammaproteobacteria bacterium]|nr:hypothetical protein [Gammaproteobacteria bacterium]
MKQLERTAGYAGFFTYRMYGIAQGARDGGARMYRMYGKHKEPGMAVRVCTGCTDRYKLQATSALPPSVAVV